MRLGIAIVCTTQNCPAGPIWYFLRAARHYLCMGVSGTAIMGANGQLYRKREQHFGKQSSQRTYVAIGGCSESWPKTFCLCHERKSGRGENRVGIPNGWQ